MNAPLKGDCDINSLSETMDVPLVRMNALLKGDCDDLRRELIGLVERPLRRVRMNAPFKGDCDRTLCVHAIAPSHLCVRTKAPLKGDCDWLPRDRSSPDWPAGQNECAAQRRFRRAGTCRRSRWVIRGQVRMAAPLKGDCDPV